MLAAGCALAGTAAGQMFFGLARAQQAGAQPAALAMTMAFMAGNRARFDNDKFTRKALPLLREIYGGSVERIELRTAATSAGGVPPSILATTTMWIVDVPAFSQKLGAHAERINKELDAVSRGNRQVTVDRIALELGDPRASVSQGDEIFSLFYPSSPPPMIPMPGRGGMPGGRAGGAPGGSRGAAAGGGPARGGGSTPAARGPAGEAPPQGEGAPARPPGPAAPTFDAGIFLDEYLPKLYAAYGEEAVRRLEATLGQDQGGQKATYVGAYHLVIRNRRAFDGKSGSVFGGMQQDAAKFTNIMIPSIANMRVSAIA